MRALQAEATSGWHYFGLDQNREAGAFSEPAVASCWPAVSSKVLGGKVWQHLVLCKLTNPLRA